MARKTRTLNVPKTGILEQNVDAILRSRGLALNSTLEKILDKSRRRRAFVPGRKRAAPEKKVAKPARGKQLRGARRAGRSKS